MIDYTKPHIYKRQILATGKYYIGKHKGGDKYYKGSGKEYKQDLNCYKEYKTEILEYINDISKLNEREEWWLQSVDAANNPLYYNKTNKPFGPSKQTKDWKINQSNRMKGKSTTKNKKWKVQDTSNMKGGGTKGKTWKWKSPRTEEQKQKISKAIKGRDTSLWKDKIYTSERNGNISKKRGEGILQIDSNNIIIKEWISFNEVRKNGYPGVQGAIRRNKEYKGYIWKRKKDLLN
jgi:hypothetical protein